MSAALRVPYSWREAAPKNLMSPGSFGSSPE
jgi:hypothetical protein